MLFRSRLEHVVLAATLVFGVGVDALRLEQGVALLEVEQRARGNGDSEQAGGRIEHGGIVPRNGRSDCDGTPGAAAVEGRGVRSEEHTSELQSLMRTSYAVFCLNKKT